MASKKLKLIAIIVVSVLCIGLFVLIMVRTNLNNNYSKEELSQLKTILANSNLIIDDDALPRTKNKMVGYSVDVDTGNMKSFMTSVFSNATIAENTNSISFRLGNGSFNIYKNLTFSYENDSYLELAFENEIVDLSNYKTDITSIVKEFLNYDRIQNHEINRSANKVDIDLYKLEKLEGSNNYKAYFIHNIGDKILNNTFTVVLQNGNVTLIQGDLIFIFPKDQLSCENASIVNILIEEKRYIDNLSNQSQRKITKISYGYEAIYDESEKIYYLPLCFLEYEDGKCRTYDYVTGDVIK